MYGQIILQKRTFCSTRMSIKEISDVAFGQHRFLLFAEVTKAVENVNANGEGRRKCPCAGARLEQRREIFRIVYGR